MMRDEHAERRPRITLNYGRFERPNFALVRLCDLDQGTREEIFFSQIARTSSRPKQLRFIKKDQEVVRMEPNDVIAARFSAPYLQSILERGAGEADFMAVKLMPFTELVLHTPPSPRFATRMISVARAAGTISLTTMSFSEDGNPIVRSYLPPFLHQIESGSYLHRSLTQAEVVIARKFPEQQ